MTDTLEHVARVGLAGWIGESDEEWDTPSVLGVLGEDLYLVEIDASNRERVLLELVDRYEVDEGSLGIELGFFGSAGGFFASSMRFLELWPKSPGELPADVFVDDRYKAAFTTSGDVIVMSVRHALRPDAPPRRELRFRLDTYQPLLADLARESQRLRDDLLAAAQGRAPEKVASLARAFDPATITVVSSQRRGT
jgi:hypothetical protein